MRFFRSERLTLLALLPFIAACGGGGSSAVAPAVPKSPSGPVAPAPNAMLLSTPARGVLVTVSFPLRDDAGLDTLINAQSDRSSPLYHHFITPQQFRESYGPDQTAVDTVDSYLRAQGFTTQRTSLGLIADGPQSTVESAFHIRMHHVQTKGREAMSVSATPTLPGALAKVGASVSVGSFAKHVHSQKVASASAVDNRYSPVGPYWFTDLKQAYGFPANGVVNGAGRSIAIVISSDVLDSDTAAAFGHEKFSPVPFVERHPVLGGPPPFDPNSGGSDEASLDVQESLGSAPGARVLLYDIPDLNDTSTLAAYTKIVEDNKADIVSSSFGLCELYYTADYNGGTDYTTLLKQQHNVFRQGNAQGITFVASSGDNGAYECYDPTFSTKIRTGVSSPADDTAVVAVGGTNLVTANTPGTRNSAYVRESAFADVYNAAAGYTAPNDRWGSGGGVSTIFKKPAYQYLVNTHASMRTTPDVAMHMGGCPYFGPQLQPSILPSCNPDDSADIIYIGGGLAGLIGTSASAPEFAGLLAVTESTLGTRLGNGNDYIYAVAAIEGSNAYHNAIPGDNGYPSTPGYNYVVGVGTPKAANFSFNFGAPLAGVPQTPSNP